MAGDEAGGDGLGGAARGGAGGPGGPAGLPGWAVPLVAAAGRAGEDVGVALGLAREYGRVLPLPGGGRTAERWAVLAAVAERNLTVARVLEAHCDALAILAEAGDPPPDGTWGVFAAEAPGHRRGCPRVGA